VKILLEFNTQMCLSGLGGDGNRIERILSASKRYDVKLDFHVQVAGSISCETIKGVCLNSSSLDEGMIAFQIGEVVFGGSL